MLRTTGIHHITAIASDPQRNLDFYTKVLGLRFVKKTVNFDDPGTYHFYFGDESGSPGTILTFFPWPHVKRGEHGSGEVSAVGYLIPAGTREAWRARLAEHRVRNLRVVERFGAKVLAFEDPDGMALELVEADVAGMPAWTGGGIGAELAIRGFSHARITVRDPDRMERILVHAFGMTAEGRDGAVRRYRTTDGGVVGGEIQVEEAAGAPLVELGGGIVHHLAMRAKDDAEQAGWARQMLAAGLRPTPVQDRNYFRSIYFREPQGVLFEIATDGPGFDVDEPRATLGGSLKLPARYEGRRAELERVLPRLTVAGSAAEDGVLGLHEHVFEAGRTEGALLLLHGTGGDERDLLGLGRKVAPGAALLSPRGNVSEHGQNRFFRRFAEGVFDLEDLARRVRDLAAWLGAARERYGLRGGLNALGFSNGANTAAAMLLSHGRVLGRAVLLRGMVTAEPAAGVDLTGVRVLLVSGERDPIIPVENAKRLAGQLRGAGAEVRHEVLAAGHELTGRDLELAAEFLR